MKKVLLIFISLILLLVAAIVVVPIFFKDDIVSYIKNETINGEINFDEDIHIGLISTFPDLNISIKDLSVVNAEPFLGDTLLSLKELKATVDLMQIISGNIEVKSIDLNTPRILVTVNKDSIASYDIMLPSDAVVEEEEPESQEASTFEMKLSSLTISNADIVYRDSIMNLYAAIDKFNFNLGGKFSTENMEIATTTSIAAMTVDFDGVKYLNEVSLGYKAGLLLHLAEEKYELLENELSINELGLHFDGYVDMNGDAIDMDVTYGLTKTEFKSILSLIPAIYLTDFSGLEAHGAIQFDGFVRGSLTETSYPAFDLNLGISDGAFQYPDLPTGLNNTQVAIQITNPGKDLDLTVVDVSKFHIEVDKEPFDLTLLLKTPMSDPFVAAKLEGKIMLDRVATLVPMEGVETLKGLVEMNVEAKGNMSAIEKEQYEKFYAAGNLGITDFAFKSADVAELVGIPSAQFEFTPEYADLSELSIILGKSDVQMAGKIENYMPYLFHGGTIVGNLELTGNYVDLNPWMTEEAETTTEEPTEDDYEMTVVEVPDNINFAFNALIKQVDYDNMNIENVRGKLAVKDQIVSFTDLGLDIFGGGLVMNGAYATEKDQKPKVDLDFNMNNINVREVYTTFSSIEGFMPMADQFRGDIGGTFEMEALLANDMMPIEESINALANIRTKKLTVEGNETWGKVVKYLGWSDEKKNLELKDINPKIRVIKGEIFLDTMDFKLGTQAFAFGGVAHLDQSIDYAMDTKVPAKGVSQKAEGLLSEISKNKVNIDLADELDVRFMIFGQMAEPEFKPVVMGADGKPFNLKNAAKAKAKELAEQGKEELKKKSKEELRKQALKLKSEAEQLRAKAKGLKQEAAKLSKKGESLKAESDKLRKQADAKKAEIEKEMSGLPKKLREKAMGPVNKLFGKVDDKLNESKKMFDLAKKPEQQADKLISKADDLEKKADDLLKE